MRHLGLIAALVGTWGCSSDPSGPAGDFDAELPAELAEVDPTLVAIDLGVHAIGSDVVVDVPERTLGATIVGRAHGDFGFESLRSNDASIVEDYGFDGVTRFVSVRPRVGHRDVSMLAMALPQSDAGLSLVAGTHRLTLGAAGDAPATEVALTLWLRRDNGPGGAFDVRVFAAEGVAERSYLEEVVSRALDGFAGLALGNVSFRALPDEARVIDDDSELVDLLALTAGQRGVPFVNIIAASDMSGMLGSPVGRAAGIPAIGAEHGTELSGLAFEVTGELGRDAQVVRHEVGHLAGLFHTTDALGNDPLADTPSCADIQGSGCPDEDNIMFPRHSTQRGALSATQRQIVRASTLYRASQESSEESSEEGALPPPTELPEIVELPPGFEGIDAICGIDAAAIEATAGELQTFAGDARFPAYLRKRALRLSREPSRELSRD